MEEEILYRQKMSLSLHNFLGLALWFVLLFFLVAYSFVWYWIALAGALLVWEIWTLYNYQSCEYVLYKDRLALNKGANTVAAVPIREITGVYMGGFRSLVTGPEMQVIASDNIEALPKLGRNSEIVAVTYQEQGETRAVLIQPTLTLRLVLEEQVKPVEKSN